VVVGGFAAVWLVAAIAGRAAAARPRTGQ